MKRKALPPGVYKLKDRIRKEVDAEVDEEWTRIVLPGLRAGDGIRWPLDEDASTSGHNSVGGGNVLNNVPGSFYNNVASVGSSNVRVEEEEEFTVVSDHEDVSDDRVDDGAEDTTSVGWQEQYSVLQEMNSLEEALKYFFLVCHLSRDHANLLLAIMRKFLKLKLPKDSRTFLKTPTRIGLQLAPILGGRLWYQGVETVLKNYFRNVIPEVAHFTIQVSIDGLPLYKSSSTQFWPILIKVEELPDAPVMPVAIFCGQKKPESIEQYLRPFVQEMNTLIEQGLKFGDKLVTFSISAFIADSPARAFIKSVKGFNAFHGCTKCTVLGVHIQPERKTILDSVNAPLRTDAGFRAREDKDHHIGIRTPLEDIQNLNMIVNFPVSDRLHLIDLGVSRKILKGLLDKTFENFGRWSPWQKERVSEYLVQAKLPSEVHRPYRALETVHFWKATEYRTFLHYISVVVYKDYMYFDAYNHYLLYLSGVTILSSSAHQSFWPLAERLLKQFVKEFKTHYGRSHMTSNVHNLLHVHGDVVVHGPLDNFSAYCFENHLQIIKRNVKSGAKCLEQVVARAHELASFNVATTSSPPTYPKLKANGAGVHVAADFVLLPSMKDQWFLTRSEGIVKFLEAKKSISDSVIIIGIQFNSMTELFKIQAADDVGPLQLSSAALHIYKVKENSPSKRVEVPLTYVKCKLVAVSLPSRSLSRYPIAINSPLSDTLAFFPLLHTFQPC